MKRLVYRAPPVSDRPAWAGQDRSGGHAASVDPFPARDLATPVARSRQLPGAGEQEPLQQRVEGEARQRQRAQQRQWLGNVGWQRGCAEGLRGRRRFGRCYESCDSRIVPCEHSHTVVPGSKSRSALRLSAPPGAVSPGPGQI
jgi:hypothetical protein